MSSLTAEHQFFAISYSMIVNGRRHTGTYELDLDRMTRDIVVRDILEGQFENVVKVFTFNPAEHTCEDITADIARDVAVQLSSQGEACPEHLEAWMHDNYGTGPTLALTYEATGEAA